MRSKASGLKHFEGQLNPRVVEQIETWADSSDLQQLHASLLAHTKSKTFFDAYAEAMVARHLMARGCDLSFEAETPTGKHCDFQVARDGLTFYLHVKRLDTSRPVHRSLVISSRLRVLERIDRPYMVGVRWRENLTDEEMQQFVTKAAKFIRQARVGEEFSACDEDNVELGGVRIVAPWESTHVSLVIGLPSGFIDESHRMMKLLKKAYEQFMPKALNVILICSNHLEDRDDFGSALLGEHVERWDIFPPRGRRIAYGRAADGLWEGTRRQDSIAAGWFHFDPTSDDMHTKLWLRPDVETEAGMTELLSELFNETGS